jgi:hypothetical protein
MVMPASLPSLPPCPAGPTGVIVEPAWPPVLAGASAGSLFGSNVSRALHDTAATAISKETKL